MIATVSRLFKYAGKPKNIGVCPVCEGCTVFIRTAEWLRDHYICIRCNSIPRQRAIIKVINSLFPTYRSMTIHESSPSGPASAKLKQECPNYVPSHFYPDLEPGEFRNGFRCENLERMTIADESFNLVITQDVMEHVLKPNKAFAEIARILKPGGAHVFTVPLYKGKGTVVRAIEKNGRIHYLKEKDFHGNPIDKEGSLVVTEWGDELIDFIEKASGLKTEIFTFNDRGLGLVAEFLDVFVSAKPRGHSPESKDGSAARPGVDPSIAKTGQESET